MVTKARTCSIDFECQAIPCATIGWKHLSGYSPAQIRIAWGAIDVLHAYEFGIPTTILKT